ncbi:hypothetical protein LCGC14_0376020 [marine sediment metagenome]|uniref:Uncharacterized protein n=1 Tax=marine sediment metagenome TaxID=412755 RepID=A0A0F9T9P0_9ZZZZ
MIITLHFTEHTVVGKNVIAIVNKLKAFDKYTYISSHALAGQILIEAGEKEIERLEAEQEKIERLKNER